MSCATYRKRSPRQKQQQTGLERERESNATAAVVEIMCRCESVNGVVYFVCICVGFVGPFFWCVWHLLVSDILYIRGWASSLCLFVLHALFPICEVFRECVCRASMRVVCVFILLTPSPLSPPLFFSLPRPPPLAVSSVCHAASTLIS